MVSTSSRRFSSAARSTASVAWSAFLASSALWFAISLAPGPVARASGRATHDSATFRLDNQTEWVVAPPSSTSPGSSTRASPFDLGLSARHAPAGATVEVLLYPRLRTRYDFKTVVHGGPRNTPLATTNPVALSSLPSNPHSVGVSLSLSIVQAATNRESSELGLACAPPTGSGTCTGVYPVVVELQRASGKVVRRLTTFLTYVAGKSGHPLELSWVVPVESPLSLAPRPTGPARAIRPLSAAEASRVETLIAELHASSVPVTLDVSPETLQALDLAGTDGRVAVATLAAVSADPSTDEVLARPYVPIDLGALAGAGEPTEIDAQMAAGATVLRRLHVRTTGIPSPWVQTGPVGNDIAAGLAQVHATQLVLPETDLAATTSATNSGTWVSTFSLSTGHGGATTSVDAAETDTWLDGQFVADPGDPALAATQLLADLAMVHFERPNTTAARGMIAVPPTGWSADPIFDLVLLDGLTENPVVQPVTLSRFFSAVASAGTRQLLEPGHGGMTRALARSVSRARVRISEFDEAVAGSPAPPIKSQLDDLLLASESSTLPMSLRAAGVSAVERLITAQLGLVKFASEKTFTLTARTGTIPITIDSTAPYRMKGTLSVSGDKFVFAGPREHGLVHLDHATNSTSVRVEARSSGDLPLYVAFKSPDGKLVIARDTLTVRSTATSVLGIVLTVVALGVLLAWWARTWLTGHRKRRSARLGHAGSGEPAR